MQTRWMSLVESMTNIAVGYGIAVLTQVIVFPLFGLHATLSENLSIGLIFTLVSLARSYALRRLFNARGPAIDAGHACIGDGLTAVDMSRLHK